MPASSRAISRRRFLKGFGMFGACVGGGLGLVHWANNDLTLTESSIFLDRLPSAFDGLRIVQLSDLHGAVFGHDNDPLVAMVRDARPDLIACTGDMVDALKGGEDTFLSLVQKLMGVAPVYSVPGNHEWARGTVPYLASEFGRLGATMLRDTTSLFEYGGARLMIAGLSDYRSYYSIHATAEKQMELALGSLEPHQHFLLLGHRPQHMDLYVRHKVMLALVGHNHGGQFRIPGLGGLISPEREFLPKYDAGVFRESGTVMYVHRSLGNSIVPVRVMNPPEVALLTLRSGRMD